MRDHILQTDRRILEIDAELRDVDQRLEEIVARLYGLDDEQCRVVG